MHPDNPKWEYVSITVPHEGVTSVVRAEGGAGVIPNEHISESLNRFGKDGWELVLGTPDSNGTSYILKRRV